jgi:AmmeMemoRadiSam system protein A
MSRLSSEEKALLLQLARSTLEARLGGERAAAPDASRLTRALRSPAGAFVSLHRQGELRGCVGIPEARLPLYRAVMDAAVSAAFADPRFSALGAAELAGLEIEISVLTESRPIAPDEIQIGIHGLMVSRGRIRGLLLPQVALERGWDARRFLAETCRKAGLDPDAWRGGARVEAFQAEVFGEQSETREVSPG